MLDIFVWWLLPASVLVCLLLLVMSSAKIGRSLGDLEYQKVAKLDGVLKIRAWKDVRTHYNRVILAIAMMIITIFLLADVPIWVRTPVNRLLFVIVPVIFLWASFLDWLDDDEELRLMAQDKVLVSQAEEARAEERQNLKEQQHEPEQVG